MAELLLVTAYGEKKKKKGAFPFLSLRDAWPSPPPCSCSLPDALPAERSCHGWWLLLGHSCGAGRDGVSAQRCAGTCECAAASRLADRVWPSPTRVHHQQLRAFGLAGWGGWGGWLWGLGGYWCRVWGLLSAPSHRSPLPCPFPFLPPLPFPSHIAMSLPSFPLLSPFPPSLDPLVVPWRAPCAWRLFVWPAVP